MPSGSIEFDGKVEEVLKREFIEETEIILNDYNFVCRNEYFCDYLDETEKT